MALQVQDKLINTDEEGFLLNPADWSEEVAEAIAKQEGYELKDDHLGLVDYFREYWDEHGTHPTMHIIAKEVGHRIGLTFHDHKACVTHLYHIFPSEPIAELCKLSGLPKPLPSEREG